jgi:hypothetical protein
MLTIRLARYKHAAAIARRSTVESAPDPGIEWAAAASRARNDRAASNAANRLAARRLSLGVPMPTPISPMSWIPIAALAVAFAMPAEAADIGQIKVAKGNVSIERGGQIVPAAAGVRLQAGDVLKTGADGSVGLTMSDNSLLSAGPNSILALNRYEYDSTTSQGQFDATLQKGSLAVISGRIAKQSPEAMTVRTPSSILGVRGTEFVVSANDD